MAGGDQHPVHAAFDVLVDSIHDYAIFMLDPHGRIITWNQGAQRIKGYAASEIIGEPFAKFYAPEDIAWGKPQHVLKIAATEGRCEDEGWRLRKDGSRFWANAIITALHDRDGGLLGFAKVTRDISDRRQAEQELKDNEARLRNIVNQAVDGIITIDEQGVIESVNPAVERIFGFAADELIGRNVRLLMPNPYHEQHDAYLANYRRTGERKIIGSGREVLGRRRDGSIFPVDLAVSEVRLGGRRIFTGVVRDITERKKAEQALRDSEARHRAILEAAVDGIITIDEHGIVESVNPAAERLFGYAAQEMIGHNVSVLMPPPYREQHDQYLANYRATGIRKIIGSGREVVGRKKDGSTFPMDLAVSELVIAGRRMFTGLVHDVTDRKKAEQERDQLLEREQLARGEAERANKAKDEFLAVLSHELRTPLTPALLTLSMLEADPRLPRHAREDVEVVRRNVELEARLIDDLLDLTRVSSGKLTLSPDTTDLHVLIHNALKISEKSIGIDVTLDLSAPRHHVYGDPARLQQVLWNLLNNAFKFTPLGGRITIRSSNPDPSRLRVDVSDTGRGIEPELLPRIFRAFEQGDATTARSFGGLGLGLAISDAIMRAHGGTITAASEGKGKGATFTIEIATQQTSAKRVDSPRPGGPAVVAPRALSILIVEDHEPTLTLLGKLMRRLGHDVALAASVEAAKQLAEGAHFDLVLSDIGLPDATGYELMRYLKPRFGIKGIALSGYGMPEDVRKSHEAGFSEHLTKPVDFQRLAAVVAHVSV